MTRKISTHQIQNGRLSAIINFIMPDIWKTVPDSYYKTITIKQNVCHGSRGLGLVSWGATSRSLLCQGHIKVTARSNQGKTGENSLLLLCLLQFSSEMSMMEIY